MYELHITNVSSRRTTLDAVDVIDGSASPNTPPLLNLEGSALEAALRLLGAPPDEAEKRVLPGGRTALVFVWVTLRAGAVPAALTHRFALQLANPEASTLASQMHSTRVSEANAIIVRGVDVPVSTKEPLGIAPPLEGDHRLAANGPGNGPDHRRTALALAGEGAHSAAFRHRLGTAL